MKTSVTLFCALLLAGPVFAQGVYNMAKQQARNAVASEEKNQQAIGSSSQSSSAPPAQNNQQPDPVLQATLQNISNLRADFDDSGFWPDQHRCRSKTDLTTAAQAAKPSPELAHQARRGSGGGSLRK